MPTPLLKTSKEKFQVVAAGEVTDGEFILIYGPPGSGKTRFACSAMRADPERWGSKAVYVAVDPRADKLESVLLSDRSTLLPVRLTYGDPYLALFDVIHQPWKEQGIRTIILDTLSTWSKKTLAAVAESGKFSEKHKKIGEGPTAITLPMEGDYLATQNLTRRIVTTLENSGMNVILLCHTRAVEPRDNEGNVTGPAAYGGPDTVGNAMVSELASATAQTWYMETKAGPGGRDYWLYTQNQGIWIAKGRFPVESNPMAKVKLNEDPINGWQIYKEAASGGKE